MYRSILIPLSKREENLGSSFVRQPGSLANRIPRRSLSQVYEIPISADGQSLGSITDRPPTECQTSRIDELRVAVSAVPSSDRNCRHNLFVENGSRLKKLDLPSTTSVMVSQRFDAERGDMLRFNYVVLLYSKLGSVADRPAVRAVLINHSTESSVPLMSRSMEGGEAAGQDRSVSRFRQSLSFTLPDAGHYELRFITTVDRHYPGSEAHLLVNSDRLVNRRGVERQRLASLSCVGRVRQVVSESAIN
jgi:hypothetical protein